MDCPIRIYATDVIAMITRISPVYRQISLAEWEC